jgi:malonyl CoA-acyl carrier protein transacylase
VLEKTNTAFLFLAFVLGFPNEEKQLIETLTGELTDFYKQAETVSGFNFRNNNAVNKENTDVELYSQLQSYVFSCALSEILKNHSMEACLAAGYSMGIYAALYHTGSVDFSTGLNLIVQAYNHIRLSCQGPRCGMASIIGLEKKDIEHIISTCLLNVEIINNNGFHSFVISGNAADIAETVKLCRYEGAIHTRIIPVSVAYHSYHLKEAAANFGKMLPAMNIKAANTGLISIINQRVFSSREEILLELQQNLCSKINWMATMQVMLEKGITTFVECGTGETLYKIGKFIEGNFKIFTFKSLYKLIKS